MAKHRLPAFLVALLCLSGCAIERPGFEVPNDDTYAPTGVAVHPNQRYAYIVNSNTDQRYNSGSVITVDLSLVSRGNLSDYNRAAILKDHTMKIDNYGSSPTVNGAGDRMFVTTRGQNLLFALDIADDGATVSCGDKARDRYTTCDDAHIVQITGEIFSKDLTIDDTSQPFVSAIAPPLTGLPGEYLYLTHLNAGVITVYDITRNSKTNPNGFAGVSLLGKNTLGLAVNGTGAIAVINTAGRRPLIYAGSNRSLSVRPPGSSSTLFYFEPQYIVDTMAQAGVIPLYPYLGGNTASIDVKYITPSPDGSRLFFLTREPNALVVLDTSLDTSGTVRNRFVDVVPLERSPATMVYVSAKTPGARDLLFVSCFGDGSILVFDAKTLVQLNRIKPFERGPYALAVAYLPDQPVVLATFFNDDAVWMIDASTPTPSEPLLARIGSPREEKSPK
jgi:DNA-binding beta-propeller fold protein YncE